MAAPPLAQPVLLFRSEAAGSNNMDLSNPQSTPLSHSPNQPLSPIIQSTQVDDTAVEDEYASFTSEACQPVAAAALQAVTSSGSSSVNSNSSSSNSNSNSHSLSPSLTQTTDTDSDQSNTPKKHRSSKSHKKHHHHHHHHDTDIDDGSSKKKRSSSRSKSDRDASDKEGSRSGSKRSKEVSIAPPVVAAPALRFTPSGLSSSPPGSMNIDPRDRSRSPMSSSSSSSHSHSHLTRPTRSASTASTSSISPQSFLDLTGVGSDTHNLIRGCNAVGSSSSSSISSMDGVNSNTQRKPKPNPAPKYDTFGDHPRPVDHSATLANVSDLAAWLRQHGFDSSVREKCILGHHATVSELLKTTKMELKNLLGVKDGIRMFHLLRDVETAHAALTSSSHNNTSSSRPRISPSSFLPPSANSNALHSHHSTTLSHSRELHQPGMYGYCSCMDCDLPAANSCALKHCERALCVAHSNKNLLTGSIVCAECYSKMTYMENIKGAMGITALQDAGYQVNQCSIQ